MMLAEVHFHTTEQLDFDRACEWIEKLFGALRQNGQTYNDFFPIVYKDEKYITYILIPEKDSLDSKYHNHYVIRDLDRLKEYGIDKMSYIIVEEDCESSELCSCNCLSYILYTTYISMESSLRCGICFLPVPLYRIPPTYEEEYYDIINWQTQYKACDTLWMKDCIAISRMYKELSRFDSKLSTQGREICKKITTLTDKPVYYYLFTFTKTKISRDKNRCPSCGQPWRIDKPWHDMFDLKCDNCYLLGSILKE
jgi:predicted  nucleic acid-binding Zn ribbon protein